MGQTLGVNPSTVYNVSEGQRFAGTTTLVVVSCATCGVTYAIPQDFYASARAYRGDTPNGWKICCPFGHTWWYVGETREEMLARQAHQARRREMATRDLLRHEERSHAATKGHLTRQKRRAKAGLCPVPGCRRHLKDLDRHMARVHPGFNADH